MSDVNVEVQNTTPEPEKQPADSPPVQTPAPESHPADSPPVEKPSTEPPEKTASED